MPKKKLSFEDSLSRLSEIIEEIEDSDTKLDLAIKLYKEGIELTEKCEQILCAHEEEITVVQK